MVAISYEKAIFAINLGGAYVANSERETKQKPPSFASNQILFGGLIQLVKKSIFTKGIRTLGHIISVVVGTRGFAPEFTWVSLRGLG